MWGQGRAWHGHLAQLIIFKSSLTAECIAASVRYDDVVFVIDIFMEVGIEVYPVPLCIDNQRTVGWLRRPQADAKNKYLALCWHIVRERVEQGDIINCLARYQEADGRCLYEAQVWP